MGLKFKNTQVYGLEESIIRSGYPMQVGEPEDLYDNEGHVVGDEDSSKDYKRANKLAKVPSGSGHDNFLKGIIVQFDLQYPEYFSPQLQRYNWIDIVSSQSKMHKITSRKLTRNDFTKWVTDDSIRFINQLLNSYNAVEDKKFREETFNQIISNLPSGYLKWMGITTNYLQLKTIYNQRKSHKLSEWREFCDWIEELPMSNLIINK